VEAHAGLQAGACVLGEAGEWKRGRSRQEAVGQGSREAEAPAPSPGSAAGGGRRAADSGGPLGSAPRGLAAAAPTRG
jgi:hypothetical protein